MKNLSQIILVSFITAFVTASATAYVLRGEGSYPMQNRNVALNQGQKDVAGQEIYEGGITQEQRVIDVVRSASPSVVSVVATKDLPVLEQKFVNPFGNDDFFNNFFGPFQFQVPQYEQKGTQKQQVAGGTGFIVSADGTIITNRHVVDIEGAQYTVVMNDGQKYSAQVIARDPVEDIAVLKIEKTGLPALSLGDSDSIQVGQSVIAIGNALGEFQNTVSVGVVAGLSRNISIPGSGSRPGETIEGAIQTDAAINPGNSGGPLLNTKGEVIGINTAIVVGSQNIGFAVPVNKARRDLAGVQTSGKITYPYLGVRYTIVNEDLQKQQNLSVSYGALVIKGANTEEGAVTPGSPADIAGIKEGDIILSMDGQRIDEDHSLLSLVQKHQIGDTVTLKVLSQGVEKTVQVGLAERPAGL